MSKEVKIIQCAKCNRELFRKETGDIRNDNGTYAMNTQVYIIKETECPYCQEVQNESES